MKEEEMGPEFSESVSASATRHAAGAPSSVDVVIARRALDPSVLRRLPLYVIGAVVVLLVIESLIQAKLDALPQLDPNKASVEYRQWQTFAAYVLLGSFVLPSLIAFFGFYRARGEMRDAIAGAFLIAFMVILTEGTILNLGEVAPGAGTLRETLITNFMGLLGTIALFYFGSEALIQASSHISASRIGTATALSERRDAAPSPATDAQSASIDNPLTE
jgi:hypothetical protein